MMAFQPQISSVREINDCLEWKQICPRDFLAYPNTSNRWLLSGGTCPGPESTREIRPRQRGDWLLFLLDCAGTPANPFSVSANPGPAMDRENPGKIDGGHRGAR
ncbi:hypothetical protein K0M31_003653 [Melipona bicolor]|uniref:Uncharacterized protein n=1 Tax=Melipona bicolor TaxID=60889 RepID=A0AA40FZK4_9HYME|nr:hypothetical protein K0M31_003653 [Melipona bicolor]